MPGGKNSICINIDRVLSITATGMDVWLSSRNIKKFKDKRYIGIFTRKGIKEEYKKEGLFEYVERLDNETRMDKGRIYCKCRLRKYPEEDSGL